LGLIHRVQEARRTLSKDSVTEWLRRWTRNPLGSARRGSHPLAVVLWRSAPNGVEKLSSQGFLVSTIGAMPRHFHSPRYHASVPACIGTSVPPPSPCKPSWRQRSTLSPVGEHGIVKPATQNDTKGSRILAGTAQSILSPSP
jgi:hypothetical protein